MSISEEYEAIYRRIEDLAGIDRTPRLLEQINALELSDYKKRLELLSDIGYKPINFDVWKNFDVLSECEWTNLLIGVEPMKPDVPFPNPDDFNVLISTVNVWLVFHRLIHDKLLSSTVEIGRPAIVKRGKEAFSNNSYRKTDLIAATTAASIPIPSALGLRDDDLSLSSTESPRWVFRESKGGMWEIGDEAKPEIVKGVTGFSDMAFVILTNQTNPLLLPGSRPAASIDLATNVQTTPDSGIGANKEHPGEQSWTGFGSDDITDPTARAQYEIARQKIVTDIETAIETGNTDAAAMAQANLDELEHFINEGIRPGGMSRKLSHGDLVEVAMNAARDRKSTAIDKLIDAGLHEIAEHLKSCYKTRKREVVYVKGRPLPDWILK